MEKTRHLLNRVSKLLSIKIETQLKVNGIVRSPALTFLCLLLGAAVIVRLLVKKLTLSLFYPILKRLYKIFLKRRNMFLSFKPKNIENWVLVNGSCTSIGQMATKIFAKAGYSLILVDSSLSKLQQKKQELAQIFPILGQSDRIKIINLNFAMWRDSTTIEYYLHETILERDPNVPTNLNSTTTNLRSEFKCPHVKIFVNCIGFISESKTCEAKLFHELQLDQIYNYQGNTVLGFTILFNYYTRLLVHSKKRSTIINFMKKDTLPWERSNGHIMLRIARFFFFIFKSGQLYERTNLSQFSSNEYTQKLIKLAE